jgi:hypothetical protein
MAYDPLLSVLGLSQTNPTIFSPTATRVGVAISPAALPSSPVTGGLAIDSGAGNALKWWDGSTWRSASGITALTGDVTGSGSGSVATTIAANAVTFAKFQQVATSTFLGRITAGTGNVESLTVANAKTMLAYTPSDIGAVPTSRQVIAGTGLSGGGALTADVTLSLPNVGTAATYGSATQVPVLTTDAQGRITGVVNTSIAIAQSQVTNLVTDLASKVNKSGDTMTGTLVTRALTIADSTGANSRALAANVQFGYSTGYRALILGSTGVTYTSDAITISLGVDPTVIAGGTFSGDGRDLIVRRTLRIMTPNAGGTDWDAVLTATGNLWNFTVTPQAGGINLVLTNDSRLSDARTPTAHVLDSATHTISGKTAGQVLLATGATTYAFTTVSGDATMSGAGALTLGNNVVTYAKFQQVAASSLVGNPTGALANAQGITLAGPLSFSGTTLTIANGAIGNALLTNSSITIAGTSTALGGSISQDTITGLSGTGLIKRTGANTLAIAVAGTDYLVSNQTITLSGDVTGSGSTAITTTIAAASVTLAKMANLAANSIIGNNTGSPATPLALTGTQVTAMLDTFSTTTTTKGLVPGANNVGATYFLRADGTWAVPTGGATPGGSNTQVQYNSSGAFAGSANFTWDNLGSTLTVANGYVQSRTIKVGSSNYRFSIGYMGAPFDVDSLYIFDSVSNQRLARCIPGDNVSTFVEWQFRNEDGVGAVRIYELIVDRVRGWSGTGTRLVATNAAGQPVMSDLTISGSNLTTVGTVTVGSLTGTATQMVGATSGNVLTTITIGSGLTLSAGTLSATGGGTIGGSAANTQVAYGSGANTLTSNANFTTDGSTVLTVAYPTASTGIGSGALVLSGASAGLGVAGQTTTAQLAVTTTTDASTGQINSLANPTGFVRLTGAAPDIRGIANPGTGAARRLTLYCTNATVIQHEAGSAPTVADRVNLGFLGGGSSYTLPAGSTVDLIYDTTTQRWRPYNPFVGWTMAAVAGALVLTYAGGTNATAGSGTGVTSSITFSDASGNTSRGSSFTVTNTGAMATGTLVEAVYGSAVANPNATVGLSNVRIIGVSGAGSNTSAATNRLATAALIGVQGYGFFQTSSTTTGTVLGSLVGAASRLGVDSTGSSGSLTITAAYGFLVDTGGGNSTQFRTAAGSTLVISAYYGIYLDTPGTGGGGTVTFGAKYGVYQNDSTAFNYFGGYTSFGGAAAATTSFGIFGASTTATSSIRLTPGVAPTSPVNGDMWITSSGAFARVNNSTVQLDANQTITLSGDVTGSGTTAISTTIANSAVTLAKMANLAANSIIGNNTGGSATPLALTGTQVTAMLDTFSTSTTTKGLVPGSNSVGTSYYLRADGTWAIPPGSGISTTGTPASSDIAIFSGASSVTNAAGIAAGTTLTLSSAGLLSFSNSTGLGGTQNGITLTLASTQSTGTDYRGIRLDSTATNADTVYGAYYTTVVTPTAGTGRTIYAAVLGATANDNTSNWTSGTVYATQLIGQYSSSVAAGGNTLNIAGGAYVVLSLTSSNSSGTTTINTAYGVNVAPAFAAVTGGGTLSVTTYYGLYLGTVATFGSGTLTVANRWGVYQNDAAANNYFAGNVGIGTAPAAALHLTLGERSANWFNNGIGIRYDASTFTDSGSSGTVALCGVHQIKAPTQTADVATTYTNASTLIVYDPTASTNVTMTTKNAITTFGGIRIYANNAQTSIADSIRIVPNTGGTNSNIATITVGSMAASFTHTIPGTTGTSTLGTGTNGQVAIWSGTNTVTGNAGFTYSTTSGFVITVAGGTNTAVAGVNFVGGTGTYNAAANANAVITGMRFALTETGAIANSGVTIDAISGVVTVGNTATGAGNKVLSGVRGAATATSQANNNYSPYTLSGGTFTSTFNTSSITTGTGLTNLYGAQIVISDTLTGASGTITVTNVAGLYINPGTFSASAASGQTITNYYGIYIGTPTLNNTTATNRFGIYQADASAQNYFAGRVYIQTAGAGLGIKEGSNAKMGTATLVAGTVTVNTTAATGTCRIFLCAQSGGAPGALYVSNINPGTSFTITSTSGTDTSIVAWLIVDAL